MNGKHYTAIHPALTPHVYNFTRIESHHRTILKHDKEELVLQQYE